MPILEAYKAKALIVNKRPLGKDQRMSGTEGADAGSRPRPQSDALDTAATGLQAFIDLGKPCGRRLLA